ncbi:MAG: T9SS type A sorting domain-containing protein [Bacteroidota bacterium]
MKKATLIKFAALLLLISLIGAKNVSAQVKILFDATKAESAGNADWVIDADQHNLYWTNTGTATTTGNEANAQRIPTPAQSGITSSTPETYWLGGLSAWGVDMVKKGYTVETLPYGVPITYNNSSNVQDLKNYKVFVVCEPNISFTAAEKTAIVQFVQNGGGLFMISDHTISDRNNDGVDSPMAWNDLLTNNTVQNNPFGISFDLVDVSGTYSVLAALPASDTLLHGPMGNVTQVMWSNGTTMTLNTTANPTVRGIVYKTGASNTGTTNVVVARAKYGAGRVVAFGDSSPFDDGTGDTGDQLYTGFTVDANGNHERLIVNSTIWLASGVVYTGIESTDISHNTQIYPNPFSSSAQLVIDPFVDMTQGRLDIYDMNGRLVNKIATGEEHNISIEKGNLSKGMYFYTLSNDDSPVDKGKFVIAD